jgi:anion-transporting  ArsA/GET3 family ATPase
VDARPDLAEAFGISTLKFVPTKVDDRLSIMAIDTEASLREYLKIHLRIPVVGRVGPLAAAFDFVAAAAPGVREILTIGKVCYEARERHYDTVVVDAPSTGHVVGYLGAPAALRQLVRVGPVLAQTGWMEHMVADESVTGVVVVTTPEEMPVAETLQLIHSIATDSGAHVGAVVVNRMPEDRFVPRDEAIVDALATSRVMPFDAPALDGLFDAAALSVARRDVARHHLSTLREGTGSLPIIVQPDLPAASSMRRVIAGVASSLEVELP